MNLKVTSSLNQPRKQRNQRLLARSIAENQHFDKARKLQECQKLSSLEPTEYVFHVKCNCQTRADDRSSLLGFWPHHQFLLPQGIGLALVKQYIQQDEATEIVATARTVSKATELNALAKQYSGRIHVLGLDVDDDESIKAFATAAEAVFDHVDVLINNSGVLPAGKPNMRDV